MINIKQQVYGIVKNAAIPVYDNPHPAAALHKQTFPYCILRQITKDKKNFKNFFECYWHLKIDVFSNYKGDKEINDYYDLIEQQLLNFRNTTSQIMNIETNLVILDDKELGTVQKHGIITIKVFTQEV